MELKTIDYHAGELANLIYQLCLQSEERKFEEDWFRLASILHMSSGIINVDYDRIRFNSSFGWCSSADVLDLAQDELERKLVTSLCRFNFIWIAMELIIDIVVPPKLIKEPRGKINNACYFLKYYITYDVEFPAYKDAINTLDNLIKENDSSYGEIINNYTFYNHISESGRGLFLAYKFRNSLAHGSIMIPQTKQEEEKHNDNEIVEICSRLALYTIQMLIIIFWKKELPFMDLNLEEFYEDYEYEPHENNETKVDISIVFTDIQYRFYLASNHIQTKIPFA